jgi:protein CpxP
MKITVKSLLTLLSLGTIAASPLLRAQDSMAPAPAAAAPAPDAAAAPDNPPPPKKKGGKQNGMLNQLKEKLNLTDDQASQIGDIIKGQRTKGQAIREDSTLSDDDKRTKAQALMKDTHDQIRALLTPDQQKTFDAMPPMGQRGKRKKAPDADAPPPADAPAPAPATPPAN